MNALVTGGAGFIGSNLARELVNKGWNVSVIDSLITGYKKNLSDIADRITFHKGSVNQQAILEKAMRGVDYVFHLGALPSVPRSIEDPNSSHVNNVDGTFMVLLAAKNAGVKKVIYSASSSAYGDSTEPIKHEKLPAMPISPYGLMKYIGEEYCNNFSLVFGLPTVSLRYFNIFGPYQDPTSAYAAVVPKFITSALRGQPLVINGDGTIVRDFTYIDNVVEANINAALSGKAQGIYNVACGRTTSLNKLVEHLEKIFDQKLKVAHGPARPGDIQRSQAAIEKAKRDFGYEPKVGFSQGLEKTYNWYKNNLDYFKS